MSRKVFGNGRHSPVAQATDIRAREIGNDVRFVRAWLSARLAEAAG